MHVGYTIHKPQMKGKLLGFTIHYNQNAMRSKVSAKTPKNLKISKCQVGLNLTSLVCKIKRYTKESILIDNLSTPACTFRQNISIITYKNKEYYLIKQVNSPIKSNPG